MRSRLMPYITLGCLMALSVVVAVAASRIAGLEASIVNLIDLHRTNMQTLTEVVTTQSGRTITVTTTRMENEGIDAFIGRHNEAVLAAQAL